MKYKGHKMDFRLYFMIENIINGTPALKIFEGFGRVALVKSEEIDTENPVIDVSSLIFSLTFFKYTAKFLLRKCKD